MSDCRQCADYEWCAKNEECGMFKQKQMTNADRIRAMTDEELAHLLYTVEDSIFTGNLWSYKQYLDWLKQEATDGETD